MSEQFDDVEVTMEADGVSATVTGKQLSMLGRHPQMDEHRALVEGAVRELATEMPEGTEISLAVKVPYMLVTNDGQLFDAKFQMKLDVKPHVEKD
jgi:hypothetical protein